MLDIIVIAIIVLMAYLGLKTGFIRSLFNFAYFVVASLISAVVYPFVSILLKDTALAGTIRDKVSEWLASKGSGVAENLPDFLTGGINKGVENATDLMATSITEILINMVSIIIVFIIVHIALKLIVRFLDIVKTVPVIRGFDKIGGILIGILNGFIVVYFLLGVAVLFASSEIMDMIEASYITNYMYHNNLLLKLIFH